MRSTASRKAQTLTAAKFQPGGFRDAKFFLTCNLNCRGIKTPSSSPDNLAAGVMCQITDDMKDAISKKINEIYPFILKEHDKNIIALWKIILEIKGVNNNWIIDKDARYTIFGEYESLIKSSKINALLLLEFINQPDWWEKYNSKLVNYDDDSALDYISETDKHNCWSLFIGFYSLFEHGVKVIQIHKGNKNKVIEYIINDLKLLEHKELLNFARWTRNSIHNNEIHFPDKANNDSLSYNLFGNNYHFNKFQRVEFSWNDCFLTIEKLISITREICLQTTEISNEVKIEDIK